MDDSGLVILLQGVAAVAPALPFAAILAALGCRTLATRLVLLALACGLAAAAASLAAEFGIVKFVQGMAPDAPPADVAADAVSTKALFLVMLVLAGLPEEGAKLLCLTQILMRSRGAVRGRDAILLGGWIGLSFGTIENLATTLVSPDWMVTAAVRALYAVPLHASMGLIGGAIIAASRRGGGARLALALGVIAPLHAAANTVLARIEIGDGVLGVGPAVAGAVLMLAIWATLSFPVRHMLRSLDHERLAPGTLTPDKAARSLLAAGFASLALALAAALLAGGAVIGGLLHDQGDLVLAAAALLPLAFVEIAPPLPPRKNSG